MRKLAACVTGIWLVLGLTPVLGFPQKAPGPQTATVTFTFDFPGSVPDRYSIKVDSTGHASYVSGTKSSGADSDSNQPFRYDFTISDANRARIFDLAGRAHYFAGAVNYSKHGLASTGTKTLSYKDAQRNTQATYNFSVSQPVQQLTTLFQSISATLEFGQRLEFEHKYQKLALDEELKRMEEMANQNSLDELQAVAPILRQIFADKSVMNMTRARAERLLAKSGAAPR